MLCVVKSIVAADVVVESVVAVDIVVGSVVVDSAVAVGDVGSCRCCS